MALKISFTVCAGLLCALGSLFGYLWWVSFFGVALFLWTLSATPREDFRRLALYGFLFGVAFTGGALVWFWNVLPLDWMGVSNAAGVLYTLFSWGIVTVSLAIPFCLFAMAFSYLQRSALSVVLLAPSLWVLSEYLQTWIFAFLTWNTQSLWGPHFSASHIGYTLSSFSPLLQLASVGGIYLLSFTVVFVGAALFLLHTRAWQTIRTQIFFAVVVVLSFALLTFYDQTFLIVKERPDETPSLRLALISTNFSPDIAPTLDEALMRKEIILDTVRKWATSGNQVDLLVFPEGGRGYELALEELEILQKNEIPAVVDSGIVENASGTFVVQMHLNDTEITETQSYEKIFLVPQGEYTPWLAQFFLKVINAEHLTEGIRRAERLYARGTDAPIFSLQNAKFGALFCSDILSPYLYKSLAKDGAQFFVNASSLAALHGSSRAQHFTLSIAKVRAVENGRFMAISTHESPASIISDRGALRARSSNDMVDIITYDVPLREKNTLYTTFGPWILTASIFIIMYFVLRRFK